MDQQIEPVHRREQAFGPAGGEPKANIDQVMAICLDCGQVWLLWPGRPVRWL